MMDKQVEDRIRQLAQPLWESAGEQYGTALDCWLMAEKMVLEMAAATTRIVGAALDSAVMPDREFWEKPSAVPTERIREMAYLMWDAAGRQQGAAIDFWLAAEKHVLAVMRAATATVNTADENSGAQVHQIALNSQVAYLDCVRQTAYSMWEAAGKEYGRALDFWLQAEQQVLDEMTEVAAAGGQAPAPESKLKVGATPIRAISERKRASASGSRTTKKTTPTAKRTKKPTA